MTLSFRTERSGQIVQTQIRLLLEEQSDQGLHCLLFHLHHFDKIPFRVLEFTNVNVKGTDRQEHLHILSVPILFTA